MQERGRHYFPAVDLAHFTLEAKAQVEQEIARDFSAAFTGIKQLPEGAKLGVYLAYVYYRKLFNRIRRRSPQDLRQGRIKVANTEKLALLVLSYLKYSFNWW